MLSSKSTTLLLSAVMLLFLTACDYGFKDHEDNISMVVEKERTRIAHLDTLIAAIADTAGIECPNQSCAEFDIFSQEFNIDHSEIEPSQDKSKPLTIWLRIIIKEYNSPWDQSDLYIDIYNCNSYDCTDADKIIVHDHYYKYQRMLKSSEFTITRPDNSEIADSKGITSIFHFFNLKIDVEGIKINWNVQIGKTEYIKWEHFHFVPIWG